MSTAPSESKIYYEAFVVPPEVEEAVAGKSVLLVDDEVVSRWTMTIGARLLRQAGATSVLPFAFGTARLTHAHGFCWSWNVAPSGSVTVTKSTIWQSPARRAPCRRVRRLSLLWHQHHQRCVVTPEGHLGPFAGIADSGHGILLGAMSRVQGSPLHRDNVEGEDAADEHFAKGIVERHRLEPHRSSGRERGVEAGELTRLPGIRTSAPVGSVMTAISPRGRTAIGLGEHGAHRR